MYALYIYDTGERIMAFEARWRSNHYIHSVEADILSSSTHLICHTHSTLCPHLLVHIMQIAIWQHHLQASKELMRVEHS